jgi:hypothetical protein
MLFAHSLPLLGAGEAPLRLALAGVLGGAEVRWD